MEGIKNSIVSHSLSTVYQKTRQILNRKETKIKCIAAGVFAGLVLTYLNSDKITEVNQKLIPFPNADEECTQQLSLDSIGSDIADVFGGVRGFCSLPKLEMNKPTLISDPKVMSSSIMRGVYNKQNHLVIKTEVVCDQRLSPDCPNGLTGVEHLVWGRYFRRDGVYQSVAQNGFAHLDKSFDETKRILSDLYHKGTSEISLEGYVIFSNLSKHYTLKAAE